MLSVEDNIIYMRTITLECGTHFLKTVNIFGTHPKVNRLVEGHFET